MPCCFLSFLNEAILVVPILHFGATAISVFHLDVVLVLSWTRASAARYRPRVWTGSRLIPMIINHDLKMWKFRPNPRWKYLDLLRDLDLDRERGSDLAGDLDLERDFDASLSRLSRVLSRSTDLSRDFERSCDLSRDFERSPLVLDLKPTQYQI